MTDTSPKVDDIITLQVDRMAHGGEGIATGPDGRIVFVRGGFPGDVVNAVVTKVNKRLARAQVTTVTTVGPYRGQHTCPAAAAGAGCCDFSEVLPEREVELKTQVLWGQLSRVTDVDKLPEPRIIDLPPHRGWRTRVRLGVDEQGRAGGRKLGSRDLVTDVACTQAAPGLLDGIVGPDAERFTPGAEVIAVMDSHGQRHVVETRAPGRGERVEQFEEVLVGSGEVSQRVGEREFHFPPTAFWQAHVAAPETYSQLVEEWAGRVGRGDGDKIVAWDLYGGVGLFVPALATALGEVTVYSVDYSPAAFEASRASLVDLDVQRVNQRVDRAIGGLPTPTVVVLDPPRTGAGDTVVDRTAQARPHVVIHIGCDPATFSRDVKAWQNHGYRITDLAVVNAFPGTHHFEVIARLGQGNSTP